MMLAVREREATRAGRPSTRCRTSAAANFNFDVAGSCTRPAAVFSAKPSRSIRRRSATILDPAANRATSRWRPTATSPGSAQPPDPRTRPTWRRGRRAPRRTSSTRAQPRHLSAADNGPRRCGRRQGETAVKVDRAAIFCDDVSAFRELFYVKSSRVPFASSSPTACGAGIPSGHRRRAPLFGARQLCLRIVVRKKGGRRRLPARFSGCRSIGRSRGSSNPSNAVLTDLPATIGRPTARSRRPAASVGPSPSGRGRSRACDATGRRCCRR